MAEAVISDDMMLKAVALANERDKTESKVQFSQSQLAVNKGDNYNQASRPGTSVKASKSMTAFSSTSDVNGNVGGKQGKGFVENCPFDIICDFLQAIMKKKYKEAQALCKTMPGGVLLYEPENEIVKEFRGVLDEMVKEDENSEDESAGALDKSESSESESTSSLSEESESESISSNSSDETSSSFSDTSSAGMASSGVGDPLSKVFGDDSSSEEDEEGDGDSAISASSQSSSYVSSESSTDASEIAELLMAGAYGNPNHPKNQNDDTFDTLSSLDFSMEDSASGPGLGDDDESRIEDLGDVKDVKDEKSAATI